MTKDDVADIAWSAAWKVSILSFFAMCTGRTIANVIEPPIECRMVLAVAHNAADTARIFEAREVCRP